MKCVLLVFVGYMCFAYGFGSVVCVMVVRVVCSVLCVLHAFRQFCVHLYVLCQFCACGCDLCVVV